MVKCDCRYSLSAVQQIHAQFNREIFAECLGLAGVDYFFMGRELGARRIEFASRRVALLCAEKDPITCYRTIPVCRHLRSEPIEIRHILEDGEIETNAQPEDRLLDEVRLPPTHLFCNRAELVEQAYDLQGDRIAYVEADDQPAISGGLA